MPRNQTVEIEKPTDIRQLNQDPAIEQFSNRIQQRIDEGYPRQLVIQEARDELLTRFGAPTSTIDRKESQYEINSGPSDIVHLDTWHALTNILAEHEYVMANRCELGREMERAGRMDEAIELYMQNVGDMHYGYMSYDRLSNIYVNQNDYTSAVNVCEAYLALPYTQVGHKEHFQSFISKLREKTI